ncbi:MAG: DNA/RNA non-specific endonuclease [Prevotellaceae bacterium]|jgi:endonuclease G|nr:DNA/RNA non-specific endonuclease [Prevotellaceae bacterium]
MGKVSKSGKRKEKKTNGILIAIGFVIAGWLALQQVIDVPENGAKSPLIENVEIPAKITGRQEQIITHAGYTVSYNSDWKIPNWVAYELTKEEVDGVELRGNHFIPDPEVPFGKSATTDDYKNSGWDRGHMAPAADMKWSEQAMTESFYLSNICPQDKSLNSGVWKSLEEQVRGLALQKGKIYVVCGPVVSKRHKTIGNNEVAVPDAFFKALLQNDNGNWHAIAFMFANESGRKPLSTFAMSVKDIQNITDIDFFPALPDSIEDKVESHVDFTKWNISR